MKEWVALDGAEELWLDLAKEARRLSVEQESERRDG